MLVIRYTVYSPVIRCILTIAPAIGFIVEIGKFVEHTAGKKVILNKPHKAFHGSFGKWMPGLAQLCFKADISHEEFIILLPDGTSFIVTL